MHSDTPPSSEIGDLDLSEEILDGDVEIIDLDEDQGNIDPDDDSGEEEATGTDIHDDEEPSTEPPERDDSILTFAKHSAPVFCAALHPTESLAVTGGEDDKAYVWNIETGDVVFEVAGHKDSVVAAEFSHDGVFLATADMAGEIQVFKTTKDYKKVWEFSMGDLCWMRWHFGAWVLIAGAESGEIYVWRIPSGECKVLQGVGEKCDYGVLTPDGKRLAAGYGNGVFKVWDLKAGTAIQEVPAGGNESHEGTIISIAADKEGTLFLTGGEDGKAILISSHGPIGALNPNAGTVECVLLDCPDFESKLAVTGTLEGKVTIWDVARQMARCECEDNRPSGITRMIWGKDQSILAGTLGGELKIWDVRSGQLKLTLLGHAGNIHELCYDKTKNILLTASEDRTAKIFNLVPTV